MKTAETDSKLIYLLANHTQHSLLVLCIQFSGLQSLAVAGSYKISLTITELELYRPS